MRKLHLTLALSATLLSQSVLANDMMGDMMNKSCAAIAKACTDAGYVRGDSSDKKFWMECMKPVVMGKTVKDVKIDASTAKDCRMHKIEEMKKEIKEMESVK
jgi:hypothetical protein